MKKLLWCAVMTLILCLVLSLCIHAEHRAARNSAAANALAFEISSGGYTARVGCWARDAEHCFVFLPSYAEPDGVTVALRSAGPVSLDGTVLSDGMDCGRFAWDTEYALTAEGCAPVKLQFVRSAGVAAMYIDTPDGGLERVHADKRHREDAEIALYDRGGALDYRTAGADRLRGHGNASWLAEKKPYNLYLERPADLLGMGAAENWVLLANAYDTTNLRDKLIYDFAGRLAGYEGFASSCEFTDLYINGEYRGLYLLSEKAEAAEHRVELGEGGYLFDFELAERVDTGRADTFLLNPGIAVEVRSPAPCTAAQSFALRQWLLEWQEALLSGEGVRASTGRDCLEDINLDSWARRYLIDEIFINGDAGANSSYFFLSPADGRLYAGPCWDCDYTFGRSNPSPYCLLAQRVWKHPNVYTPWYPALWRRESFRAYTLELYREEFLPELYALLESGIAGAAEEISAAAEVNYLRWAELFEGSDVSFEDGVEFLTEFLSERIAFLNSVWLDGTEYRTVTLRPGELDFRFICVEPGAAGTELPAPEEFGLEGVSGWYREDDGTRFDPDTVITEDLALYAKKSEVVAAGREERIYVTAFSLLAVAAFLAGFARLDRRRNGPERRKRR